MCCLTALLEENKREESEKLFLPTEEAILRYEQCRREKGFSEHTAFRLFRSLNPAEWAQLKKSKHLSNRRI